MVQSSNGNSDQPKIEVTFEPVDDETQQVQDRWVEQDGTTGDRKITYGDEVRGRLDIEEEDEEPESK